MQLITSHDKKDCDGKTNGSTSEDVAIANIQHLVAKDDILEVARLSTCLERREASPLWVWPPTVSRILGEEGDNWKKST